MASRIVHDCGCAECGGVQYFCARHRDGSTANNPEPVRADPAATLSYVIERLTDWVKTNDWERVHGRELTLLNPHTVLDWLGVSWAARVEAGCLSQAQLDALLARSTAKDRRCVTCGHPESNHPYRHPFVAMA